MGPATCTCISKARERRKPGTYSGKGINVGHIHGHIRAPHPVVLRENTESRSADFCHRGRSATREFNGLLSILSSLGPLFHSQISTCTQTISHSSAHLTLVGRSETLQMFTSKVEVTENQIVHLSHGSARIVGSIDGFLCYDGNTEIILVVNIVELEGRSQPQVIISTQGTGLSTMIDNDFVGRLGRVVRQHVIGNLNLLVRSDVTDIGVGIVCVT